MDLKTAPMLAVTSIHDRSGKRVGSYLVDKSKDAPNRQKKHNEQQADTSKQGEAVVFHHSETTRDTSADQAETGEATEQSALNLTV